MTTLTFEALWRDRGAAAGLKNLATQTSATKQGFVALKQATEQAAVGLRKAHGDAAAASRKVGIEEKRLQELRTSGKAKASQILAAEDRLATARRKETEAIRGVTTASRGLERAQASEANASRGVLRRLKDVTTAHQQADQSGRAHTRTLGRTAAGFTKFGVAGAAAMGVAGAATVGLGAGLAATVGKASKFDATMRTVATTTGETGAGMEDLTKVALDMGAKTSFSAQGASDAMLELARGGMTAAQMKAGALQQTLTLATAGGLELGDAAQYMVSGLTAFNLKAKDAGRVAAALAGGANASTASVQDMGYAFQAASASASAAGLSIEDTAAAVAALANNGIKGSDAGTSLKTMFAALQPQTKTTASAMADLGLVTKEAGNRFFDSQGRMKSMSEIAGLLSDATKDLTNQERTRLLRLAFGSDAVRAAIVLAKEGRNGLTALTKATSDQTQADKMARTATSGYAGALERFKGSVETAGIQVGTKLLPPLSKLLDWLSGSALPRISSFGSTIGPVFDTIVGSVSAFARVAKAAFGAFSESMGNGRGVFQSFADFVVTHQAAITTGFVAAGKVAIGFGRALATVASVGLRAFAAIMDGMAGMTESGVKHFRDFLRGANIAFGWVPGLGSRLKIADAQFAAFSDSVVGGLHRAADSARGAANGIDRRLSPALDAAGHKLDTVGRTEIWRARQRDAANRARIAIDAIGTAANGSQIRLRSWNERTKLGADAQRALEGRIRAARQRMLEQRDAGIRAGASQADLTRRWNQGRDALFREFRQMGLSSRAARELANRYARIPRKVETRHSAPGADHVRNQATALRRAINAIDGKTVKIRFTAQTFSIGGVKYHVNTTSPSSVGRSATGGKVRGPGTGTSDSVMGVDYAGMPTTRVSRGEWVINAKSSAKHDALLRAINEDGLATGGRLVKLRADFAQLPRALVRQPGAIQHIADDFAARVGPMLGRAVMKNVDSGMVGGKGFVNALRWARSQVGKPYIWTGVGPRGYDCSGFMSAIINVIKGRSPYHRLFSTGMAGGAHLAGMTKGKSSPFRIGVWKNNPGHTAGTLNGVNVESAGGVGVRVGRSARGATNGLFTMRYGLAKGGRAGDAPYDTTHQGGERYDPQLEKLWKMLLGPHGLHTGGVVRRPTLTTLAERGPERVLSAPQTRTFERMVSAMDRGRGVGGNTYHVTINAPNYVGSKQELRDTIVGMARKGQLDVIKR